MSQGKSFSLACSLRLGFYGLGHLSGPLKLKEEQVTKGSLIPHAGPLQTATDEHSFVVVFV